MAEANQNSSEDADQRVTVRIPAELHNKLIDDAAERRKDKLEGSSVSSLIAWIVADYYEQAAG